MKINFLLPSGKPLKYSLTDLTFGNLPFRLRQQFTIQEIDPGVMRAFCGLERLLRPGERLLHLGEDPSLLQGGRLVLVEVVVVGMSTSEEEVSLSVSLLPETAERSDASTGTDQNDVGGGVCWEVKSWGTGKVKKLFAFFA